MQAVRVRQRWAVLATATLVAGVLTTSTATSSDASVGDRLLHRAVTHSNGQWVTTMEYTNERIVVTSSRGPANVAGTPTVATRHVMTATGTTKTVHGLSGEIITAPTSKVSSGGGQVSPAWAVATPHTSSPLPGRNFSDDCFDVYFDKNSDHRNSDGSILYMGHLHACDHQRLVRKRTATDWYMYDQWKGSASMHDYSTFNPDELTGVLLGIRYGAYNVIQDWAPIKSIPTGSCKDRTNTVEVGIDPVKYTVAMQQTICPATEGLYDVTNTKMRTKWDGQGDGPHNGSRATFGQAAVHSPSKASPSRSIPYYLWWE